MDIFVVNWTIYGFAIFFWWLIFRVASQGNPNVGIQPSFQIIGIMCTLYTVVNFSQSLWGYLSGYIQA